MTEDLEGNSSLIASRAGKPLAPGLYLIATPIGNLEDITLRALRILTQVDRIACEDTRQTQKLLHHYSVRTPTVSYHLHNELVRTEELIAELKNGAKVAVVSDAGTPGIADPGAQIAAAAIAAGIAVFPVPGANAALSALVASGLPAERFTFHGFLPAKSGARRTTLEQLSRDGTTHILYETPHRIAEALADLEVCFGSTQPMVLARELTKLHEEFLRGTVSQLRANIAARPSLRGEMVLLLHLSASPAKAMTAAELMPIAAAVAALMATENLPEKDALKRIARERGIGKSEAYREFQRTQINKR